MNSHEIKPGDALVIARYRAPVHTNHVPGKCLTSVFAKLNSDVHPASLQADLITWQIRVNGELRIPKNTPYFGNVTFGNGAPVCFVTCIPLHSDEMVDLVILNQLSKTSIQVFGGLGIVDFVES